MSYIFLDTETHAKENPIIIQLAYRLKTKIGGNLEKNELFSTGGEKIDFGAMAVHHITEKMISDRETFNNSIEKSILSAWIGENYILVAHNAPFDVGVLNMHGVEVPKYICTLKLARYIYPEFEAHNLQYLRYRLGLEFEQEINPHDAMSDVIVLEKLFLHLITCLTEKMNLLLTDIDEDQKILNEKMIQITRSPSLLYRCMFGKYAGKLWSEVPRDYLDWVLNKSGMTDEDVVYTAKHYFYPLGKIQ